ncbi:transcriptional regulator BetI [Granulibacter bethesdensis]|uniref:transcriptional regulator BetI n=1 Tax=Granulibacter bethesdensis TaxID=364410 RepID=UPI0003F216DA|nr:transcriptional regulator BetI [Granulibacter bethesdensis]AHJ65921.1 Regulatory protein betI [Granulibacter bethesdensis CGDNIH4]
MPKVGMQPIRRAQLIRATLQSIDEVGLSDTTVARIARIAGVSTGIIAHYFQDKEALLEAAMRQILADLFAAMRARRKAAVDDTPRTLLRAIVEGNFDGTQTSTAAAKAWLAFWSSSMHQPHLRRLQQINAWYLHRLLRTQFLRVQTMEQAHHSALGLAALIDGLWLRATLAGKVNEENIQVAFDYIDQKLITRL